MNYYSEPDSHNNNNVEVSLALRYYATIKELNDTIGVDTSTFAAKRYFIALKAKVEKVDIDKLKSVPNGFTNF